MVLLGFGNAFPMAKRYCIKKAQESGVEIYSEHRETRTDAYDRRCKKYQDGAILCFESRRPLDCLLRESSHGTIDEGFYYVLRDLYEKQQTQECTPYKHQN